MNKKIGLCVIIIFLIIISGCIEEKEIITNQSLAIPEPEIVYSELNYVKADDTPITLINYRNATNPTWNELINFLQEDNTDSYVYDNDTFVCGDFAELLHNNAEIKGIRAGICVVEFINPERFAPLFRVRMTDELLLRFTDLNESAYLSLGLSDWNEIRWKEILDEEKKYIIYEFGKPDECGHIINVFNTSDKGTVYVDSTGMSLIEKTKNIHQENIHNDAIAYISEGFRYGLITIDETDFPDYEYYAIYEENLIDYLGRYNRYNYFLESYERGIDLWNTFGRGCLSDEYYDDMVKAEEIWSKYLDDEYKYLNYSYSSTSKYYYEPLGIVEDIEIFW